MVQTEGPRTVCAHPGCSHYIGMNGQRRQGLWHCSRYCADNNTALPSLPRYIVWRLFSWLRLRPGSTSASTKVAPDILQPNS